MERTCGNCRHYSDTRRFCLRYPQRIQKSSFQTCGEHQRRLTVWAAAWTVVALLLWLAWLLGAW